MRKITTSKNMLNRRNEEEKVRQARLNAGISNNKFSSSKLRQAALNTRVPNFANRSTGIPVPRSQLLNINETATF